MLEYHRVEWMNNRIPICNSSRRWKKSNKQLFTFESRVTKWLLYSNVFAITYFIITLCVCVWILCFHKCCTWFTTAAKQLAANWISIYIYLPAWCCGRILLTFSIITKVKTICVYSKLNAKWKLEIINFNLLNFYCTIWESIHETVLFYRFGTSHIPIFLSIYILCS